MESPEIILETEYTIVLIPIDFKSDHKDLQSKLAGSFKKINRSKVKIRKDSNHKVFYLRSILSLSQFPWIRTTLESIAKFYQKFSDLL